MPCGTGLTERDDSTLLLNMSGADADRPRPGRCSEPERLAIIESSMRMTDIAGDDDLVPSGVTCCGGTTRRVLIGSGCSLLRRRKLRRRRTRFEPLVPTKLDDADVALLR